MHSYVLAETTDGTKFDGIITGLDDEYVYFAVPVDPTQPDMGLGHLADYTPQQGLAGYTPSYSQQTEPTGYAPGYGQQPGPSGQMPQYAQQPAPGSMPMPGYPQQPGGMRQTDDSRYGFPGAFGYGYGFPGYGYGFPPRRFARLVLPLAALVALSALPWY